MAGGEALGTERTAGGDRQCRGSARVPTSVGQRLRIVERLVQPQQAMRIQLLFVQRRELVQHASPASAPRQSAMSSPAAPARRRRASRAACRADRGSRCSSVASGRCGRSALQQHVVPQQQPVDHLAVADPALRQRLAPFARPRSAASAPCLQRRDRLEFLQPSCGGVGLKRSPRNAGRLAREQRRDPVHARARRAQNSSATGARLRRAAAPVPASRSRGRPAATAAGAAAASLGMQRAPGRDRRLAAGRPCPGRWRASSAAAGAGRSVAGARGSIARVRDRRGGIAMRAGRFDQAQSRQSGGRVRVRRMRRAVASAAAASPAMRLERHLRFQRRQRIGQRRQPARDDRLRGFAADRFERQARLPQVVARPAWWRAVASSVLRASVGVAQPAPGFHDRVEDGAVRGCAASASRSCGSARSGWPAASSSSPATRCRPGSGGRRDRPAAAAISAAASAGTALLADQVGDQRVQRSWSPGRLADAAERLLGERQVALAPCRRSRARSATAGRRAPAAAALRGWSGRRAASPRRSATVPSIAASMRLRGGDARRRAGTGARLRRDRCGPAPAAPA